jgi:hypothetical protein
MLSVEYGLWPHGLFLWLNTQAHRAAAAAGSAVCKDATMIHLISIYLLSVSVFVVSQQFLDRAG